MHSCRLCANVDFDGPVGGQPPSGSDFDRVLRFGPRAVVTPTLGMIVPGYLMAVARSHRPCFGAFGRTVLVRDVEPWVREVCIDLQPCFGDYMIFEHGSAGETERRGGCITHAHLHLIPCDSATVADVLAGATWKPVAGLASVVDYRATGYGFLSAQGRSWLCPAPSFPGQWIRRVVARHAGVPNEWDWEIFRGRGHLEETLERLGLPPHASVAPEVRA